MLSLPLNFCLVVKIWSVLVLSCHKLSEMLDQDGDLFQIPERVLRSISKFYSLLSLTFNKNWKFICANSLMSPCNPLQFSTPLSTSNLNPVKSNIDSCFSFLPSFFSQKVAKSSIHYFWSGIRSHNNYHSWCNDANRTGWNCRNTLKINIRRISTLLPTFCQT